MKPRNATTSVLGVSAGVGITVSSSSSELPWKLLIHMRMPSTQSGDTAYISPTASLPLSFLAALFGLSLTQNLGTAIVRDNATT